VPNRKAYQHHADAPRSDDEGKPTEVLVLGEEDPRLGRCESDDLRIDRSVRLLGERSHIVPSGT
jgi:hypothetical protein